MKNPLTSSEKQDIKEWANTQYKIARRHKDEPAKSEFYRGRSVGMGKVAQVYNPTVIKGKGVVYLGGPSEDEMFNFGKDWLVWSWRDKQGHWFTNKTAAKKFMREVFGLSYKKPLEGVGSYKITAERNPFLPTLITGLAFGTGATLAGAGLSKVLKNPTPRGIVVGQYYCPKCKRWHRRGGRIYKQHWVLGVGTPKVRR